MPVIKHNLTKQEKRRKRVRSKIVGTNDRPRLTVFRSNKYISLQVINDETGKTIASASDLGKKEVTGTKTEKAKKVTVELVKNLNKKKIKNLKFDRGSYKYHGRVKAVAETLREEGINV
ncbi:MAG: 50S ribosomal protein L18 [Candidatus Pacebacteria bacterium]|jgi:large subunit ribosomal protein L18|nr:50S ribosomal protein L18 [Candidatus Paceibacterota bacterium]MBT4652375.1 50S ribosomal protein L18 [Candidatus Paceibacterota bacterium]MBT6756202.1 50S ribosomal protein L18 [Candidatus Paceibacterota bacterium]MBT6921493.1 50S ribosomal protein L18 [Candidatus Paceibacterota bacterium]